MQADLCVICGKIVPEGRMVCPVCEAKPPKPNRMKLVYIHSQVPGIQRDEKTRRADNKRGGSTMTNLITEARELSAIDIENQPIHAVVIIDELCDALEKAEEQNKQLMHELCKLACESVERDKALARLEAEVEDALREKREREKGCAHCQKPYVSIGGINEDKAIIYLGAERPYTKGNVEYLHHMDSAGRMNAFKVRRCPVCGKRLEVEHI